MLHTCLVFKDLVTDSFLRLRLLIDFFQDIAVARDVQTSFCDVCESAKIAVMDDLEDFKNAVDQRAQTLSAAAVILSECVLHFCLKFLYSDTESQKEKEKKRALLISQWSSVQSETRGMHKDRVHRLLRQGAEKYMA